MKVAVTGATGVIGTSVVPALIGAGHDVVGLARTPQKARVLERMGASARVGALSDEDGLVTLFGGADVVCNFATHTPVGLVAAWPGSWKTNDRLRTEGVRRVAAAAQAAGVRRLVQESVSYLYADQGDEWITEESPVAITRATEPASVGESHVQEFATHLRAGVVLRFGSIIGDDALTRLQLRAVQGGRPVGLGSPTGWTHVVHTDDLGGAVLAAMTAPSGVYNVGSEPIRRAELLRGYAEAAGRDEALFLGPLLSRLAGTRIEPLTRSLRVSSQLLTTQTGWSPVRASFDRTWFDVAREDNEAAS